MSGDMSGAALTWLVAKREITTKLKDKTFLISSIVIVVLLLGILGFNIAVNSGNDEYDVGLVDAPAGITDVIQTNGEAADLTVSFKEYGDEESARKAVQDEDVDVALVGDSKVIVKDTMPGQLGTVLQAAHQAVVAQQQLAESGLDQAKVQEALDVPALEVASLDPEADRNIQRVVIAIVGVSILYGLMMMMGQFVAQGVVEEKSSRVVELLLATVKPWQLLAGKVIGLGLLGLAQMVLIVVVALVGVTQFDIIAVPGDAVSTAIQVLLWFVIGYALFATLFAAAASLVARQEDLGGVLTPMIMVLVASLIIAIQAAQAPGGTLAQVFSLIPGFSPMVMPVRIAAGAVAWWEIVLAVVLQLVAIALLVRLGGRIYAGALLRTGGKVKVKDALKAANA